MLFKFEKKISTACLHFCLIYTNKPNENIYDLGMCADNLWEFANEKKLKDVKHILDTSTGKYIFHTVILRQKVLLR